MKDQCLIRFVTMKMFSICTILLLPTVIQQQQHQQQTYCVVDAWTVPVVPTTVTIRVHHRNIHTPQSQILSTSASGSRVVLKRTLQNPQQSPQQPLYMAGFGDASSLTDSKEVKLKPKQQWDRYAALKKETSVVVGVKVVGSEEEDKDENSSDWLEVGSVKSESTIPTEVAVARQRALLVEVRIVNALKNTKLTKASTTVPGHVTMEQN